MPFYDDGIVMVDLRGKITFANSFFCDLVGISIDKVEGLSFTEFVFPEDYEIGSRVEASKQPNPEPFSFRVRHVNGAALAVEVQATPLKAAGGEVYGVVATITPRKA